MPLVINLRHVEAQNLEVSGELPTEELDLDPHDEVIRVSGPLQYELEVQTVENGLLLQGTLHVRLACECVRCLKPFEYDLRLEDWSCHVPLEGEEAVRVVNDRVDLTPYLREDILLELPQHPLCDPGCRGLPKATSGKSKSNGGMSKTEAGSPAWAELNKLKFKK